MPASPAAPDGAHPPQPLQALVDADGADETLPVPEGFSLIQRGPSWFTQLGPVYAKPAPDGTTILGLRVSQRHANFRGNAHGGMLMTLADATLGINVSQARGVRGGQVTVSLAADFLVGVKLGDWLEARVGMRKNGRTLVFADCILTVGEREVLRSNAVFAVVEPPAHARTASSAIESTPGD
ncbi:MAG: PaaI family thioesterase [Burkholderiaceae bacterium]